jgi:hypothetical protein
VTAQRGRLLAPQLLKSDVWQDFADQIDATFTALGIEDARQKLSLLRSPINLTDVVGSSDGDTIMTLADMEVQERATLVKTADMLGFRFYDSEFLQAEDYLRLCMFLGEYYANDKGTVRFSDFMGFISNNPLVVYNTWTEDYVTFFKEGDPAIGTPVYQGGSWYPTTHVILEFSLESFAGIDRSDLIEWFYYFANINVVLWAIEMDDTAFLTAKVTGDATTEIWY